MSKLKEYVIEVLGLSWGIDESEIFTFRGEEYFFTNASLWVYDDNKSYKDDSNLTLIMNNPQEIKKMPFIPKEGEVYFIPSLYSESMFECFKFRFDNCDLRYHVDTGLACRTKEEAIERTKKALGAIFNV